MARRMRLVCRARQVEMAVNGAHDQVARRSDSD